MRFKRFIHPDLSFYVVIVVVVDFVLPDEIFNFLKPADACCRIRLQAVRYKKVSDCGPGVGNHGLHAHILNVQIDSLIFVTCIGIATVTVTTQGSGRWGIDMIFIRTMTVIVIGHETALPALSFLDRSVRGGSILLSICN